MHYVVHTAGYDFDSSTVNFSNKSRRWPTGTVLALKPCPRGFAYVLLCQEVDNTKISSH